MDSVRDNDNVSLGNNREVTATAPATVANVAVGFDVIAHTVQGLADTVTVRQSDAGISVTEVSGCVDDLPRSEEQNTAAAAVRAMVDAFSLDSGFEIQIEKGIPVSSGLGGSAASAVAAVVALNQMLKIPLPLTDLFPFALAGETSSSGYPHGDNIAASLLGGLVIVGPHANMRPIQLPAPNRMRCVVINPDFSIESVKSRSKLPDQYPAELVIGQMSNLAAFVSGCYQNDIDLLSDALTDLLVEPHRRAQVPGFSKIKNTAMEHGALGCSISGSGPSVFAWFQSDNQANEAKIAMQNVFVEEGFKYKAWITPVNGSGAKVVS